MLHYKFTLLWTLLLMSLNINIHGKPVLVSLYNRHQLNSVAVSAYNGPLTVSSADGMQYVIADGQAVYAVLRDEKIWLGDENGEIGSFERLVFQNADSSAIVRIKPVSPQIEARNYENLIIMTVDVNRILLINMIDEEQYIAGVVEAETGQGHAGEFYKAKAIICRTYMYGNINRHQNEGFHLCDDEHCQAYKGQCRNSNIAQAVSSTKDIIITDRRDSKPILATYHSNCGGETESSQNVWQSGLPYLVPVTDPYCTSSPNARWQKTIPLGDWVAYLDKKGFKPDTNGTVDYRFQQTRRIANYKVGNITIPVRQIRSDWQLRSAFFSISVENNNVLFSGRGYGHGVGLCQEGAMEMGRRGFKYGDIINFYYKNVNLTPVTNLQINIPCYGCQ